jgi:hypothetical protein
MRSPSFLSKLPPLYCLASSNSAQTDSGYTTKHAHLSAFLQTITAFQNMSATIHTSIADNRALAASLCYAQLLPRSTSSAQD